MSEHYTRPMWPEQRECWARVRPYLRSPSAAPDMFGPRWHGPPVMNPVWWGRDGLGVLASLDVVADGTRWLHASYSRQDRIPDHADTLAVRRLIFPADAVVIAVLPPEDEYVNDHPRCLHLWQRIGSERLVPDLRLYDPRVDRASV